MRVISSASRGMRLVSDDDWISRDASIIESQDRLADAVKGDALAYLFYALLDDSELREVFGDSPDAQC